MIETLPAALIYVLMYSLPQGLCPRHVFSERAVFGALLLFFVQLPL